MYVPPDFYHGPSYSPVFGGTPRFEGQNIYSQWRGELPADYDPNAAVVPDPLKRGQGSRAWQQGADGAWTQRPTGYGGIPLLSNGKPTVSPDPVKYADYYEPTPWWDAITDAGERNAARKAYETTGQIPPGYGGVGGGSRPPVGGGGTAAPAVQTSVAAPSAQAQTGLPSYAPAVAANYARMNEPLQPLTAYTQDGQPSAVPQRQTGQTPPWMSPQAAQLYGMQTAYMPAQGGQTQGQGSQGANEGWGIYRPAQPQTSNLFGLNGGTQQGGATNLAVMPRGGAPASNSQSGSGSRDAGNTFNYGASRAAPTVTPQMQAYYDRYKGNNSTTGGSTGTTGGTGTSSGPGMTLAQYNEIFSPGMTRAEWTAQYGANAK
jgi:hypothetical protein